MQKIEGLFSFRHLNSACGMSKQIDYQIHFAQREIDIRLGWCQELHVFCRVAKARTGFQTHLSQLMTSSKAGLSREDCAVIQSACLFEQLINPQEGLATGARLLRNAIQCFPAQVFI